jgi:methionyl aminopeptidase
VELKSAAEVATMREAGRVVATVLAALRQAVRPGTTTADLDALAAELTRKAGARPSFKGYRGYPATLCASINEEVVHGIPSRKRKLREGDIVGLDFGVIVEGYHGDAAITVPVGRVSPEADRLLEVTRRCLELAIEQARPGNRLHDIGAAVQGHAEGHGYSVVRDFVGHGIGRRLHEDPQVPNYGPAGEGMRLRAGLVLAIEPMVNVGTWEVQVLDDDWTAVTADGKLSAHFEHTVAITEAGPQILTLP